MNEVFNEILSKFILVFFYYTLVYSSTWQEHVQHLKLTLKILKEHHSGFRKDLSHDELATSQAPTGYERIFGSY